VSRKVVIAVGVASHPISAAGNTWLSINWALGFREAGWDVWLVEAIDSKKCVDGAWEPAPFERSANRAYWERITGEFGFRDRATLLVDDGAPNLAALRDFASASDVFLNISGHFKSEAVAFPNARKVYLDVDPAFTQVWAASYNCDMNFAAHDYFFSVGMRLGRPGTFAPTCGIDWQPLFPPVVMKEWPFEPRERFDRFTTVAHWQGYDNSEWQGKWFTGKREEFNKVVEFPRAIGAPMEIATALPAHESELGPFRAGGWRLSEAGEICATMSGYRDYLRRSSAEFSVAKGGYVLSQTGWVSDRSACYAALGRPVVVQDTGLAEVLPLGRGFHAFHTTEEAEAACRRVIADFPTQQRAARELAEEFFASDRVIASLTSRIGLA
jgi:hypothetical protein